MEDEVKLRPNRYEEVRNLVGGFPDALVSVPYLGRLLEVDSPTLNAKLRRDKIKVTLNGRTSYIPKDLALKLVEGHKYALMGWITVKEAGALIGIRPETIKARCNTGRLNGYVDLTKRLRVNPEDIRGIRLRDGSLTGVVVDVPIDEGRHKEVERKPLEESGIKYTGENPDEEENPAHYEDIQVQTPIPVPPVLPVPRSPEISEIKIITARDYGLLERAVQSSEVTVPKAVSFKEAEEYVSDELVYDPDCPPTIKECTPGRKMVESRNRRREYTIEGFDLSNPFQPIVKVSFEDPEEGKQSRGFKISREGIPHGRK